MGQPNPPGDLPLIEGLDSSWNEFVSAIPEDRRAELGPKLKERISGYEPLKSYEEFHTAGITPEQINTSLGVFSMIENRPKEIYDAIGKHLGISAAEVQEVVEEVEEGDSNDPRIQRMEQQLETLAQIALAQRQMTTQEQQAAEQDAALDAEIAEVRKKYGNDVPEDELLMRMLHKNMTAEQAYEEYNGRASEIRARRPAPMVMGQGGSIPSRAIDPTKLDSKGTKDLVRQMLDHANAQQ